MKKYSDWSNLKALVDEKVCASQEFKFARIEIIVGKGVYAGYQYFLLFLQWFQKTSYSESLKV